MGQRTVRVKVRAVHVEFEGDAAEAALLLGELMQGIVLAGSQPEARAPKLAAPKKQAPPPARATWHAAHETVDG